MAALSPSCTDAISSSSSSLPGIAVSESSVYCVPNTGTQGSATECSAVYGGTLMNAANEYRLCCCGGAPLCTYGSPQTPISAFPPSSYLSTEWRLKLTGFASGWQSQIGWTICELVFYYDSACTQPISGSTPISAGVLGAATNVANAYDGNVSTSVSSACGSYGSAMCDGPNTWFGIKRNTDFTVLCVRLLPFGDGTASSECSSNGNGWSPSDGTRASGVALEANVAGAWTTAGEFSGLSGVKWATLKVFPPTSTATVTTATATTATATTSTYTGSTTISPTTLVFPPTSTATVTTATATTATATTSTYTGSTTISTTTVATTRRRRSSTATGTTATATTTTVTTATATTTTRRAFVRCTCQCFAVLSDSRSMSSSLLDPTANFDLASWGLSFSLGEAYELLPEADVPAVCQDMAPCSRGVPMVTRARLSLRTHCRGFKL